jgi:hypoxanthine phosphoribosyltransferase
MYDHLEEIMYSEEEVQKRIKQLGDQLTKDYKGKNLFVMCVLKGSVIFLADIVRSIDIPLEYGFVTISTYKGGTRAQEKPSIVNTTFPSLEGKDVLLVEDTGYWKHHSVCHKVDSYHECQQFKNLCDVG